MKKTIILSAILALLSGCTSAKWKQPKKAVLIQTIGKHGHSMWSYNNGYGDKGLVHDFNCSCKIKERDMYKVYEIQREKNKKGGPGAREEHVQWRKGLKRQGI